MKKLLTLRDLTLILNISESTARRRHAETLAGIGNFPRSVNVHGKKMLFRPEEVEAWAAAGRPLPVAVEPASQRSKRHAAAMNRLKSKGVRVASTQQVKEA